jgi:signal transduction histidine kinase/CheY-like chemotaxis protein
MRKHGADTTLISDLFFAPLGKRYDFTVQVPIKLDQDIPYFLAMGISASQLQKLLTAQRFPKQWIGTIVDREGVVVARSRDPEQFTGKRIRDQSRHRLATTREGTYPSVTLEGIRVKAFYSHIPIADWTVLISIPESELQRSSVHAATFLAGLMIILLVVAIVAARLVANRVIRPIEELGKAAEGLGRGDEVTYVPQRLREVDLVGRSIVDASKRIHHSTTDLKQRVAEAVSATERAERALLQSQKLEALGRLTGGIAHEFNNLLQTLSTSLELAKLTSAETRVQSLIETCKKAVERATALTRQLSVFGRVQDARLVTVLPYEQIEGFLRLVKGTLPGNIELSVHLADKLWPVRIDPLQFELALLNIALNAKDAMPAGGSLRLEVDNQSLTDAPGELPPGDYVRIAVADSGSGIPAELISKVLDPFFTTKPVGKGTGMGLPQAYGFARQAGGALVLKSAEGQGTTVEIYLPRASDTAPHSPIETREHADEDAATAAHAENAAASRGVILFVEDDHLVRESVVPALKAAGFAVLVAETGEQAEAMFQSGLLVDAMLSDIVMPGQLSGIALARLAKSRFPHMKIILTTGYTDQRVNIPGVQLLAKPYEITEVVDLLADMRHDA